MSPVLRRARAFLSQRSLFALLLSSLFAVGLLMVRIYVVRQLTYAFLVWNLFLAWLPYLLSGVAVRSHRRGYWPIAVASAGLWLLFFPNAPYILTDFLHLAARHPIPLWYDLLLLASFAWTGLFLAMASLASMQTIVSGALGKAAGWLFALITIALGGLGIYVGRFLRWNSWDVVANLSALLVDIGVRIRHPIAHRETYVVTLLYSTFLFICYLITYPAWHQRAEIADTDRPW
jgi:uncharacterized membrane protein